MYKQEILNAKAKNKAAYRKAFNYFKSSKFIYDEIEGSNKTYVDFEGINKISKNLIDRIFEKQPDNQDIGGFKVRELFSAANTPEGFVDYTTSVLDGVKNRYYVNGNIGTGKTTLFKRIAEKALINNYHIEIFYNPLMPTKIDSLLIKELNTIISTSTETKNYIYTGIDFDEYFDIDKKNKEDYMMHNTLVEKAIEALSGAKENHFVLETVYKRSINYSGVSEVRENLWKEILEYK